jgi:predicted secreted Zn-dependent protease
MFIAPRAPHLAPALATLAVVTLALACSPPPANQRTVAADAAVVVLRRERTYQVEGTTATELLQSMRENFPAYNQSTRTLARHSATFRPRYDLAETTSGCEMSRLRIEVASEITMPEWKQAAQADSQLAADWRTFIDALREHEEGHRAIAAEVGALIAREYRLLRRVTCSQWRDAASQVMQRHMTDYRARQNAFDTESALAATPAIRWPPRRTTPGGAPPRVPPPE